MKRLLFGLLLISSLAYADEIKQLQIDSVNLGGKHIKPKQVTTDKLSFSADTYISEYSPNTVGIICGGVTMFYADNTHGGVSGDFKVPYESKLYLDGGDNTYIVSASADYIHFYTNGVRRGFFYNTGFYVDLDCSALTFTDRTPYPKDLEQAYDSVLSMGIKTDKNELDHSKLNEFVKSKDGEGRNLSATVSAQNAVIKDLIKRIEALEK